MLFLPLLLLSTVEMGSNSWVQFKTHKDLSAVMNIQYVLQDWVCMEIIPKNEKDPRFINLVKFGIGWTKENNDHSDDYKIEHFVKKMIEGEECGYLETKTAEERRRNPNFATLTTTRSLSIVRVVMNVDFIIKTTKMNFANNFSISSMKDGEGEKFKILITKLRAYDSLYQL